MSKSALSNYTQNQEKGFIPAILIVIGAIIILIIIGLVSGALKFSGSIKYTPGKTSDNQQPAREQTKQPVSSPAPVSQPITLSETFTHDSLKYSINYPKDWGIVQSGQAVALFSKEGGAKTSEQSEAGILLTVTPLGQLKGSKLATIADLSKPAIKKEFSGADFTKEQEIKVADYDAFVYEFVYSNKGIDWQARFYFLTDQENLYGLVSTANKPQWSKYEKTLQTIINSFKLSQ